MRLMLLLAQLGPLQSTKQRELELEPKPGTKPLQNPNPNTQPIPEPHTNPITEQQRIGVLLRGDDMPAMESHMPIIILFAQPGTSSVLSSMDPNQHSDSTLRRIVGVYSLYTCCSGHVQPSTITQIEQLHTKNVCTSVHIKCDRTQRKPSEFSTPK